MNINVNQPNVDISFQNKEVILRTENEKDFIILYKSSINLYNNNVVITLENDQYALMYLMNKFHQYNQNGLVQSSDRKSLHLLSSDFLIVLHYPIIERLDIENGDRINVNIVYNYMEHFYEPNIYIRRVKLEKIMRDINERKKSRSSSNKRF